MQRSDQHEGTSSDKCLEILEAVGEDNLRAITQDFLELLETASTTYEQTGDCVLGVFASGWCSFLNQASRQLCDTDEDDSAKESGKWLCHESCWAASKKAVETGQAVDMPCHGGIHLYAVPILAGNEAVGSINFGYGEPPQKTGQLKQLAKKYHVPVEELLKLTGSFNPQPAAIINAAKKRLRTAAKLIGTIVEQKRAEKAIREHHETLGRRVEYQIAELSTVKERLRLLYVNAPAMLHSMNRHGYITDVTDYWLEIMGYQRDEVMGRHITEFLTEECRAEASEVSLPSLFATGSAKNVEYQYVKKNGEIIDAIFSAIAERDSRGRIVRSIGVSTDVSDRTRMEEAVRRKNDLLQALQEAQMLFITNTESRALFGNLLKKLLALTDSELGFICEILFTQDGQPYLKEQATIHIDWDEETRKIYNERFSEGIEFRNLDNLFGQVILTGQPVISNDPASDPRSGGLPPEHFPLRSFLGLPFHFEGKLVGMVAIANRPGNYDLEMVDFLKPYIITCATIIQAYRTHNERHKAEESLRKSEARYRQLFTKSKAIMLLVNPETGAIEDANPAAEEFYGYSIQQLKTLRIMDINIDPEVEVWDRVRKVESETEMRFVSQHRLHSGEIRDVSVYSTPIDIDGTRYLHSIIHDITDRMKAERELKESEERFRAIFMGATDFIYTKDAQRRFREINPALEALMERKSSDVKGHRVEDLFGEEATALVEAELRALQGESIEKELTFRKNGFSMTLACCLEPLKDAEGNVTGIMGVIRDVTGRRRVESISEAEDYTSGAMRLTLRNTKVAAKGGSTILLLRESGSGKDYLAKYIHEQSERANGPYFSVNCAAIAPELAESELFGHEKGAFTGAFGRKRGLLELAEGGTLLLNEIGELSLPLQAKLLTFLDTRKFTRVGGEKEISVNARLIAATNRDLETEVKEGRFRQDLFYRINVMSIEVPSLRQRREDIPVLIQEILTYLCKELQFHEMPFIDSMTMNALKEYDWPGNVRELRNVLERCLILSHGKEITLKALDFGNRDIFAHKEESFTVSVPNKQPLNEIVRDMKSFLLNNALQRSGGSRQGAAKLLGISRDSLKHLMRSLEYKD